MTTSLKSCAIQILANSYRNWLREGREWSWAKQTEREEWINPPDLPITRNRDGIAILIPDTTIIKDCVDQTLALERRKRGRAHLTWEYREALARQARGSENRRRRDRHT